MHDVAAAFHYFPCKTVISAHEQKKMNMILGSPRRLAPAFYVYKMGVWTPHSYWNGDVVSMWAKPREAPGFARSLTKHEASASLVKPPFHQFRPCESTPVEAPQQFNGSLPWKEFSKLSRLSQRCQTKVVQH